MLTICFRMLWTTGNIEIVSSSSADFQLLTGLCQMYSIARAGLDSRDAR